MKEYEIKNLFKTVGIEVNFICRNHNDHCNCHKIYDDAA